jgi:tRNA nucleotidyltransferase/poly(A) polymerase
LNEGCANCDDPRLATLFAALAKTGAETRVVGGAVRDAMLGLPPHEIDLATTALPDAVLAAARDAGLKGVPTGIEHGTVTIVVAGTPFEVTTLREDVEIDGCFAKVRFARFPVDAGADFTINALSPFPMEIYDYVGRPCGYRGAAHRFIGDAATRFARIICGSSASFASTPLMARDHSIARACMSRSSRGKICRACRASASAPN